MTVLMFLIISLVSKLLTYQHINKVINLSTKLSTRYFTFVDNFTIINNVENPTEESSVYKTF